MQHTISKRLAVIIILGLFIVSGYYFLTRAPAPEADNVGVPDTSVTGEDLNQESGEFRQYRQRNVQALEMQRSAALTESEQASWETYENKKYGFQFKYPKGYIVIGGKELDPSENSGAVFNYVLTPDTEYARSYVAGDNLDLEPPASLGVIVYPADSSRKELADWVPTIITEEEKEVPGIYEKAKLSSQEAVVYSRSALYEYDTFVVAKDSYVYEFNVGYTRSNDTIRKDFYKSLSTVSFN